MQRRAGARGERAKARAGGTSRTRALAGGARRVARNVGKDALARVGRQETRGTRAISTRVRARASTNLAEQGDARRRLHFRQP